jgi:hypothetical protein
MKFHQNPFCRGLVVPCRQTDRYDEANSRFSQICAAPNKAEGSSPTDYKLCVTTVLLQNAYCFEAEGDESAKDGKAVLKRYGWLAAYMQIVETFR